MIIRGIYHAHSRYSLDGTYTLSELRRMFVERGFQFVIMTEHAEDLTPETYQAFYAECHKLSDAKFLFVPGLEVPYEGKVHVGCFPSGPTYAQVPLYGEGISAMRAHGATTIYHHPSKQKYFMDDTFFSLLDGVEVWNSRYEGVYAPSRRTLAFARKHFAHLLHVGGLDLHRSSQFGGPCLEMDVPELTTAHVHEALKKDAFNNVGRFYSYKKSDAQRLLRTLHYMCVRGIYELGRRIRNSMR